MKTTRHELPGRTREAACVSASAALLALALLQACQSSTRPAAPPPPPPAPPAIQRFAGNTASILAGQTVTLEADFLNGTAVIQPGNLSPTSGVPFQVTPSQTTTYILTVTNGAGVLTQQTDSVTVTPAASGLALLAGQFNGWGNADGQGALARFYGPTGVALDGAGNLYVADEAKVRKITPVGQVSTLAGGETHGYVDGPGATAQFNGLRGLGVDQAGKVYVCDAGNCAVRTITPDGQVSTLAGGTYGLADGVGALAQFAAPEGLVVDGLGNVFVADLFACTIRAITPNGAVTTLAGLANTRGTDDGTGAAARFQAPAGLALDGSGNLYVTDLLNPSIRRVSPAGEVSTVANAAFASPRGLALDAAGNLYVADAGLVWMLAGDGTWSTLAGSRTNRGAVDGAGAAATFGNLWGLALDGAGNVYVTDPNNKEIRRITPEADVSTFAGCAQTVPDWADGAGGSAGFNAPAGLAVDGAGNTYVADAQNFVIRKVTPAGQVTTLAGQPGLGGLADGPADQALFGLPRSLAVDGPGNVYVVDVLYDVIRKLTPQGTVSTLAGSPGTPGNQDGTGAGARFIFSLDNGLAVDGAGNLYVATANGVRKVNPAGTVTTLADSSALGEAEGVGAADAYRDLTGIAVDAAGTVYVADATYRFVVAITPAGAVSTLAGSPSLDGGVQDGQGSAAGFSRNMASLAYDGAGHLYLADDSTIRKITTRDGTVTTVVGSPAVQGTVPGPLPASLFQARGLALDPAGRLLISVPDAIMRVTF